MTKEFIRLNIALKPPEFFAEKAIELSRELGRQFDSHFILDGAEYFPHITVYSPEFPADNLENILAAVKNIAIKTNKLTLRGDQFEAEQGFAGVKFELTDKIKKLHENIVALLNPLREDHIREKYEAPDYKMKFSPEKIDNIKKYGSASVMELYNPHLTIIRLINEEQANKVAKNLKWEIPEFEASELGIYKMGDHGTCKELVEKFELI